MDEGLVNTIMSDLDACIEETRTDRVVEEVRLRESTDPGEHMCGPGCKYLRAIESMRETTHYVCPISNQTWGNDIKWDTALASKSAQVSQGPTSFNHTRSNHVIALEEEAPVQILESHETDQHSAPRNAPRSSRETNFFESHYTLRSVAENLIRNQLNDIGRHHNEPPNTHQELLVAQEHERARHIRPFTLARLNDIYIETSGRVVQLKHRSLLYEHIAKKNPSVDHFVNILAQLFSTLWIITTHGQIRRRELDSFHTFILSLSKCLYRGVRISDQPILPRGILFFHDDKRRHRSDSAHHALQQVQSTLSTLDSVSQTEQFQQCIRLSKQLESIHHQLIRESHTPHRRASPNRGLTRVPSSVKSARGVRSNPTSSRGTSCSESRSCATSDPLSNPSATGAAPKPASR